MHLKAYGLRKTDTPKTTGDVKEIVMEGRIELFESVQGACCQELEKRVVDRRMGDTQHPRA
jgi:hypothetical protein